MDDIDLTTDEVLDDFQRVMHFDNEDQFKLYISRLNIRENIYPKPIWLLSSQLSSKNNIILRHDKMYNPQSWFSIRRSMFREDMMKWIKSVSTEIVHRTYRADAFERSLRKARESKSTYENALKAANKADYDEMIEMQNDSDKAIVIQLGSAVSECAATMIDNVMSNITKTGCNVIAIDRVFGMICIILKMVVETQVLNSIVVRDVISTIHPNIGANNSDASVCDFLNPDSGIQFYPSLFEQDAFIFVDCNFGIICPSTFGLTTIPTSSSKKHSRQQPDISDDEKETIDDSNNNIRKKQKLL